MKSLTYVGPAAAVEVLLPPDFTTGVVVERGKSQEFDDEFADRLLEQADNWQASGAKKSSKAAPAEGSE